MILSFGNRETLKIWNGEVSMKLPITIQEIATNDFGLEILSRIITAADKTLRSSKK